MSVLSTLRIEVQRRGKVERYDLSPAPALIGSASHCDVRLSPDEAAECHLVLEPRPGGVLVRAIAREPPCTRDGQSFTELILEGGGSLKLGALTLTLTLVEPQAKSTARGSALQNVRQLLLLALLFLAAYFVLWTPEPPRALDSAQPAPPLFAEGEPRCPHAEPAMAQAFAEEQHVAADSKRERSPFDARDGVEAVPLYQLAIACFEAAGDGELARELREKTGELRQKMEDELHTRHVRLEWFIGRAKYGDALREVKRLRSMLARSSDDYGQWLSMVERELGALIERQKQS